MISAKPTLNAQCHRGTDRCSSIEYFGQRRAVDSQLGGSFANLQVQRRQDVVPEGEARMGGLNIELIITSVVVLVVDQHGIAVFKRKSQTPVAVNAY